MDQNNFRYKLYRVNHAILIYHFRIRIQIKINRQWNRWPEKQWVIQMWMNKQKKEKKSKLFLCACGQI